MIISDDANTQVPSDARASHLEKQACGGAGGLSRSFLSPSGTLQSDMHCLHHKGENESLSPSRRPKLMSQCWERCLTCLPMQRYFCSILRLIGFLWYVAKMLREADSVELSGVNCLRNPFWLHALLFAKHLLCVRKCTRNFDSVTGTLPVSSISPASNEGPHVP